MGQELTPAGVDRPNLWRLLVEHRARVQMGVDGLAWVGGLAFETLTRMGLAASGVNWRGLAVVTALAVSLQAAGGILTRLYLGRRRYGSFDELAVLALTAAGVTVVLTLVVVAAGSPRLVPLTGVVAGGLAAFLGMGASRYAWRMYMERKLRPDAGKATHLLVFGAGEGAEQVITAMVRNPESPYVPVALIDDDPTKRHLEIRGVPVVGTRADMAQAARDYDAQALLIAIPTASGELIRGLSELAHAAGLDVRVLPPVSELLHARITDADIRPLSDADLLGRHEVSTDLESICGNLAGRRVLVTGAGGSIGSELCRQLQRFAPGELIMLDRDESALHAVQLSLNGQAALDGSDVVLADIRDRDRIEDIFAERRPQVVFHAAALKHVTALQRHPCEAVKTNVWGTLHVLEAAAHHGVERFVNISTDKAADPCNVLGDTKLLAERLTAHVAGSALGTYLSVRFGNVLGSRGSVLTTFRAQIAAGRPVTVTDPEVTRYFMTVEEAVQLVVQAGAIGGDGQTLVLDMGQPVRIADVAARLVEQAAKTMEQTIEIAYTGLRPGEKLHEVLFAEGEADHRPEHAMISHVKVPALHPDALADLDVAEPATLRERLRTLGTGRNGASGESPR